MLSVPESGRSLTDTIQAGDVQGAAVRLIMLPASFTGGTRYTVTKLNDALAYVREFGGITCNPLWPEITETLR